MRDSDEVTMMREGKGSGKGDNMGGVEQWQLGKNMIQIIVGGGNVLSTEVVA